MLLNENIDFFASFIHKRSAQKHARTHARKHTYQNITTLLFCVMTARYYYMYIMQVDLVVLWMVS